MECHPDPGRRRSIAEKLTFHSWTESEPNLDPDFVSYLEGWLSTNFPQASTPAGT